MGLIKAALGSAGGVLADQWKEYFYCEALPENVMAVKGQKRTSGRSSNRHGQRQHHLQRQRHRGGRRPVHADRGSGPASWRCAPCRASSPTTMSTEPSLFAGELKAQASETSFDNMANRFTFGGEAPKDQRVYYFNTKELIGNKYGTANPVPFRRGGSAGRY